MLLSPVSPQLTLVVDAAKVGDGRASELYVVNSENVEDIHRSDEAHRLAELDRLLHTQIKVFAAQVAEGVSAEWLAGTQEWPISAKAPALINITAKTCINWPARPRPEGAGHFEVVRQEKYRAGCELMAPVNVGCRNTLDAGRTRFLNSSRRNSARCHRLKLTWRECSKR